MQILYTLLIIFNLRDLHNYKPLCRSAASPVRITGMLQTPLPLRGISPERGEKFVK